MIAKTIPTEKAEHLKLVSWLNLKHLKFNHTASIAVTHTNEHQFDYSQLRTKLIEGVYTSNTRTRESVKVFTEF